MPLFEKATKEVECICKEMIDTYHTPLRDAGVTVDLLFAKARTDEDGDPIEHALKLHGYQCAGICKINAYKLRVLDHADAEITLDGDRWDEWSEEEKRALIDHELEHIELKTDAAGNVVRDEVNRPKLKIRLHDHERGFFDSIARRHGGHSFEVQIAKKFINETYTQLWLPYVGAESIPMKQSDKTDRKSSRKAASVGLRRTGQGGGLNGKQADHCSVYET